MAETETCLSKETEPVKGYEEQRQRNAVEKAAIKAMTTSAKSERRCGMQPFVKIQSTSVRAHILTGFRASSVAM